MLDKFIFENHLGLRFVGLESGVYLNYSELRDYSWSYDTINSRISRFYHAITNRKIPLVVYCDTEEKANEIKNRLLDLAEADIQAKLPGKVFVGEYYTNGYITASKKSNYLINKRLCYIELTLTSDDPMWYREKTYHYGIGNRDGISGGHDYPYDYPYDFAIPTTTQKIVCESPGGAAFRMRIYGEAVNPYINIANHIYRINGTIAQGESLLIDSLTKTITLTKPTGEKVNWFDSRGRDYYIFEPIPPGMNSVSWLGTFAFDLSVIEKRSEPRWT